MTQPAPTKEQIAAKKLRDLGVKLVELMNVPANELAYSPYEDAADLRKIASLIEALTAQLAEARSALHSLAEFRSQDISIMRGYLSRAEQAEAAAASAREIAVDALNDARATIEVWHGPVAWEIYDRSSPEMKRLHAAIEALKSTPEPVTPSAPAEADESGWLIERHTSNGTPLWLTLAPHPSRGWTAIASEALRFARREDADNYASLYGNEDEVWHITEHSWPSFRPLPSPPTAREGE